MEEHKEHEHKAHEEHVHTKKKKINSWKIVSVILAVILIISIFVPFSSIRNLSKQKASEKTLDFINNQLLVGTKATIDSIEDTGSLYKIKLNVADQAYDSYLTKDGQLLFPTAIDMTEKTDTTQKKTEPENIPKTDKPKIELFIMGFCPYGNRAEDTMLPVYNLLKDKVEWNIHYIVSVSGTQINSLHGQPEVDEDEREACVLSESGIGAWWTFTTYVNNKCGSDGSCWKDAAKEAKLDSTKIETCVKSKGLSLMEAEAKATDAAGASGSPTLKINGVGSSSVYKYGDSDAYKEAICSAFNTPPQECSETLTSSAQTSTGGSC